MISTDLRIFNLGNSVKKGDDLTERAVRQLAAVTDQMRSIGRGGIRTHGTFSRTHAFQACSLSHSDTLPNDRWTKFYSKSD